MHQPAGWAVPAGGEKRLVVANLRRALPGNRFHRYSQVWLGVTAKPFRILSATELLRHRLFGRQADHFGEDFGAGHHRSANLGRPGATADEQDFVEVERVADRYVVPMVDQHGSALFDAVLSGAIFENRIHGRIPSRPDRLGESKMLGRKGWFGQCSHGVSIRFWAAHEPTDGEEYGHNGDSADGSEEVFRVGSRRFLAPYFARGHVEDDLLSIL